ncbi:MAG: PH domain-containing protein [Alphaproteobacteria bacterium]|nr:PH domain-containing protein [Alphaproteobacteria bacterium]
MSYIRKVIGTDEKLLATFRPHWIYFLEAVICLVGLSAIGFLIEYYLYAFFTHNAYKFNVDLWLVTFTERNTPIPWIFVLTGLAVFIPLFLVYISTEVGLTNQRVIYKRGLIFIEVDQVDLEDIRAEHVIHGWFGWMFGYGRVRLDCRFVDDIILPAIRNPYRLVKASHTARMKHPLIEYGHDEFWSNMEQIEKLRDESRVRHKLKMLKEKMKGSFGKASKQKALTQDNAPSQSPKKKPPNKAA